MTGKLDGSPLTRVLAAAAGRGVLLLLLLAGSSNPSRAVQADEASIALRDSLFRQSLKSPADVGLALAYVKASVALHDYEAAIGALERVLFYVPNDAGIKAQLGFLYYQLGSHQMARQYLDAAQAGPALDAASRAKIASIAPTVDTANTGHRLFGSIGGGLRSQTNAAFNSDSNILRLSGQDQALTHPQDRGSDGNAFGIAQIGYDHDLGNQRGDVLEARVTGYLTRQFHFTDLDVGFYDASIGPRFVLDALPGSTVKLYATGGQTFLAGQRYLASGGAGLVADFVVRPGTVIEPGLEVRRVQFSNVNAFSSLNSGSTVTASLAGHASLNEKFEVAARVFVTRDMAEAAYQSSTNVAEELAVVARLAAPLSVFHAPWSISPYVKLLQTRFDGANPFIDAATRRRDSEVQAGVVLDTPVSAALDIVTSVQESRVVSNIPNYRLHNFSVLTGPTVRF